MVLVDTSVWIEYFKGNTSALPLEGLIDANTICVNDLILTELIPSIMHRNEGNLRQLLLAVTNLKLEINWNQLIHMQTENLRKGINKVGISDLIIAQNAIDNDVELYAMDKHFPLMSEIHGIRVYEP